MIKRESKSVPGAITPTPKPAYPSALLALLTLSVEGLAFKGEGVDGLASKGEICPVGEQAVAAA